jgi:large subunit ribosomal protein L33
MAKKATILVKLESTANTGYFYVRKRNPRKQTEKLKFRKYDPIARAHVEFNETKLK